MLDAFDEADPRTAIVRVVGYTAELFERAGDLIMVGIVAESVDAGMKAGSEAGAEATYQFWLGLTRNLARVGALRPELDADSAADIAFALGSPHVFRLLRRRRGWDGTRYRNWLTGSITARLLRE